MVSLDQLDKDRARSIAGMDKSNLIVHPKVLRKELLKIYYVKDVNIIMRAVYRSDMKEPKPKRVKVGKGITIVEGASLDDIQCNGEIPIGKKL